MTATLCIAEIKDGRRALCYIDTEAQTGQVVLILDPEAEQRQAIHDRHRIDREISNLHVVPLDAIPLELQAEILGAITTAAPLHIPKPPRPKALTAEDLIRRHQEQKPKEEPQTIEQQILDDIERLQRGDDPQEV